MDELARPGAANTSGTIEGAIDPRDLGHAALDPTGSLEAGSWQTFTLTYTAGKFGIDDSGSLRICFRFAADMTPPQLTEPSAPGYTTIEASNGAVLQCRYDAKGNVRPWDKTLWIKVVSGYLGAGDTIAVRFGPTDHGSPGMRVQTFCEDSFEFRVLVDPIATFNFQPLPRQPEIRIVPGPPERFVAVLPTLRRVGEPFALRIKGEDRWGNPSDRCAARFRLQANMALRHLPEQVALKPGRFATEVAGLVADAPGDLALELIGEAGTVAARANPLRIVQDAPLVHFWGDLHGQSEETVGTGSARDYFTFARDRAFLDAACHQGNDFQIKGAFWAHLNQLTAEFDQPGRFVCIPGYEWSGNTGMGGDCNVMFPDEHRTIRRSSHALIADRSDIDTDCHTAGELFDALAAAGELDTVVVAHCGGRYADLVRAHDGRMERAVEVHSSWGTFEWLVQDAFELGYRVGIVANSDGHKGRPGASYPGASMFGAIGGLTCFLTDELSRRSILECLRRRQHYGTTGARMVVDVKARSSAPGILYHDDPKVAPAEGKEARIAIMGDIVHLPEGEVELEIDVLAAAPILRIDVFNGTELIETVRPYTDGDLGTRIRVQWEGAAYRGRARQVIWDGTATFAGNPIERTRPVNFFNPERRLERTGDEGLAWRSLTTGNFAGFDAWLADPQAGALVVDTPLVNAELPVREIGLEERIFDASGVLPRFLSVCRLPDACGGSAMRFSRAIEIKERGDNPLFIRVTQEDGHRAWTSPIYVYRG